MLFLIIAFCCHQVLTSSSTSDWTRPPPHTLVQVGMDIYQSCQADTRSGMKNVTITLPDDAVISDYFRKISNMEERSKLTYKMDRNSGIITATLTIGNASILDTGFYGCRLIDSIESSTVLEKKEYIFVHPPVKDWSTAGDADSVIIDKEILIDDLLLPTLDVYVLEEGKSDQVIPFKPTHPDVKLFLSRKPRNSNHYIEIFSTEYVAKKHDNWLWNKYRGLVVKKAQRNQTNGAYWCDAELNGRKTTRYFRIFVTTPDVFDNLPNISNRAIITPSTNFHQLDIPRIKNSVEFLIYPSGSPFKLRCQIGIGWNITWLVPENRRYLNRHSVSYETNHNSVLATLSVPESSYLDTNNYTCFRNEAPHLLAKQYVFISDHEKLLLPTNATYIVRKSQRAIIPCRPTHPDIVVSLMRTAQTGRGVENITLFPNENGYWQFSKFRGFFTKDNADREIVGKNYFCQGTRDENVKVIQKFQIFLADIELKPFQRDSGPVVEGDEITLICETYMNPATMDWIPATDNNKSRISINEKFSSNNQLPAGINYIKTRTSHKQWTTELIWLQITKAASGVFECRYQDQQFRDVIIEAYQMNVQDAKAPLLIDQNIQKVNVEEGKYVNLSCHMKEGSPLPNVSWLKGNSLVNHSAIEEIIQMSNGTSILHLKVAIESQGDYTCLYENRLGKVAKLFKLVVIKISGSKEMIAIIVVLIVIAVLLVIMARLLYIRFSVRYQRTRHASNIAKVLEPLLVGNPERINHRLPLDGQCELLPYDKTWEFPRDRLKLGQQLGAGCFGRVLKAEADGIVHQAVTQTVAVKMVRSFTDLSALASLVSELKILIHLGSQLNIVNLLGACTDIGNGDFLVIVEYCRFGSLLDYLLANRYNYIDQVNDDGEFVLPASAPPAEAGYLYMGGSSDTVNQSINGLPGIDRQYTTRQQQDCFVMYKDGSTSFQGSPTIKEDSVLANHLLSTYHLLVWSFQISRGMEYLSRRKVVHGDLAARNVLLADNNVVKIADFGLSRKVYQDSNYKKKGEGMLPVKWMAIESLSDRIFSSQSDVWAFGVTMWELFSLGKAPFSDIEDLAVLIQHLETGKRLEIPRQAPNSMAHIMANCWKADQFNRPTFEQLEQLLGNLIEPSVKNYFIELDEPYRHRNIERFGNSVNIEQSEVGSRLTSGYINVEAEVESTRTSTRYQNVEAKMT